MYLSPCKNRIWKSLKYWVKLSPGTLNPLPGNLSGPRRPWQIGLRISLEWSSPSKENEWDIWSLQLFHCWKDYLKIVISLQWGDKWHYRAYFIILARLLPNNSRKVRSERPGLKTSYNLSSCKLTTCLVHDNTQGYNMFEFLRIPDTYLVSCSHIPRKHWTWQCSILLISAEFAAYQNYVRSLRFEEKPDYAYLRQLIRNLFHRKGFSYDYVFDWNTLKNVSRKDLIDVTTFTLATVHWYLQYDKRNQ